MHEQRRVILWNQRKLADMGSNLCRYSVTAVVVDIQEKTFLHYRNGIFTALRIKRQRAKHKSQADCGEPGRCVTNTTGDIHIQQSFLDMRWEGEWIQLSYRNIFQLRLPVAVVL